MTADTMVVCALALVALAGTLIGATAFISARRRGAAGHNQHEECTLPADPDRPLSVRLESGTVTIDTQESGQEHRISASFVAHAASAQAAGSTSSSGALSLDAETHGIALAPRAVGADLWLGLARGSSLHLRGGSVEVSVSGELRQLNIEIVAGHITLQDLAITGEGCRVKLGTGDVSAEAVHAEGAPIELTTGGGDIHFTGRARELTANTAVGDIAFSLSGAGEAVTARSGAGAISAAFTDSLPGSVDLRTQAGDIAVVLPSTLAAEFTLHTSAGGIDADRKLHVEPVDCQETASGATVTCRMGEGGTPLAVSTEAGDIILRAAERKDEPTVSSEMQPEDPTA